MLFLSPWFLPALAVVAAPLILHLLNRRKRRTVHWAAMRFLMATGAERRKSRLRLRDITLLLLRMAAVAALVLFFARPLLPAGLAPAGSRDVILVLDGSLSVSRITDAGSVWRENSVKAAAVLDSLQPGDFIRILLAGGTPRWITPSALEATSSGKAQALELLKALEPGQGSCRLPEVLAEALAARPARAGLARRVVLFSDLQATSAQPEAAAAWTGIRDTAQALPGGCVVEAVTPDPVTTPPNLAVLRVDVSREQAAAGEALLFSAKVRNAGPATTGAASLRWIIGAAPSGLSMVPSLKPGAEATVEFSHACPPEPGTALVTCELDAPREDVLAGDNAASVLVETVEPPGVLLVDGSGARDAGVTDTAWIQAALGGGSAESGGDPPVFRLSTIRADGLGPETLGSNRVVILANPPPLPDSAIGLLDIFVRNGGGLWLLPGDCAEAGGAAFAEALFRRGAGLSPLRWTQATGDAADATGAMRLRSPAAPHPVTRFLQDPRRTDFASVRVRRRFEFESPAPPEAQILLTMDDGSPFLAEKSAGEGRVLAQAAPFNLAWTDWPRHHAFVVLLYEGLWRLASSGVVSRNLAPGETWSWPPPSWIKEDALPLRMPDGQYGAVRRGQGRAMISTDTLLPGLYAVEATGAGARFWVRRDGEESDLRPVSPAERERIRSAGGIRFDADLSTETPVTERVERRRPAWPLLAAAAVMALCLESLAAAVMLRRRHQSGERSPLPGGAAGGMAGGGR